MRDLSWCIIAAASFSPPRGWWGGFLGEQIWSHSRHTGWLLQINYLGELCQKAGKTYSPGSLALVKWPRWRQGPMKRWRRSGDIGKTQAAQGTGGTTSWFDWSFKVCDQHLFQTDKNYVNLYFWWGPNTHLKSQNCSPHLNIKKLWERAKNILLGPNKWNKAIFESFSIKNN